MNNAWESTFATWSASPSAAEQTRSEQLIAAVKEAICASDALKYRSTKSFVQGSYRNRVNVRADSDVDVGVVCNDVFFDEYPSGKGRANFNVIDHPYLYLDFKSDLQKALVAKFGSHAVIRGNKAFKIEIKKDGLTADVVPLFEFRQYWDNGSYRAGVALQPDKGSRIENYPERLFDYWPTTPLHYENGVRKNDETGRAFKGVVRIIKSLRSRMEDASIPSAGLISGYLVECLVYNVPNQVFRAKTWCAAVEGTIQHIWMNSYDENQAVSWTEVDGVKFLFWPSQPWKKQDVFKFACDARTFLGIS